MPPVTPEEHATILAAQRGSTRAFEQLLARYERPVYSYISRLVREARDAEDLTQETFLKVYRAFRTYNPEKRFSTWLFTIATRTVYDWLRKKRRAPHPVALDEEEGSVETLEPSVPYNLIEDLLDLERALDHLKPIQKTVLLLFYREDFTYEEIAAALKMPTNTVKTHLHRAKCALRTYLVPSPVS